MTVKGQEMFTVQTARSIEDAQNMCYQPSNGDMFTAEQGLITLERGNGGLLIGTTKGIGTFGVSHIKANNQWLRDKLKIK